MPYVIRAVAKDGPKEAYSMPDDAYYAVTRVTYEQPDEQVFETEGLCQEALDNRIMRARQMDRVKAQMAEEKEKRDLVASTKRWFNVCAL